MVERVVGKTAQPTEPAFQKAPEFAESFFHPDHITAVLRHGRREFRGHESGRTAPEPGQNQNRRDGDEGSRRADGVLEAESAASDAEKSQCHQARAVERAAAMWDKMFIAGRSRCRHFDQASGVDRRASICRREFRGKTFLVNRKASWSGKIPLSRRCKTGRVPPTLFVSPGDPNHARGTNEKALDPAD